MVSKCVLGLAGLSLAYFYNGIFFDNWDFWAISPEHRVHIALNVICNIIVILLAFRTQGRTTRRISSVLVASFVIHALFCFLLIGTRVYYARPVLFSAVLVSLVLGSAAIMLDARLYPRRVGVVMSGAPAELLGWIRGRWEAIRNCDADFRCYDVLLANFSEPMDAQWSRAIARAMMVHCDVRHLAEFVEEHRGRVSVDHFHADHIADMAALQLGVRVKRASDTAIALLALPIVTPLLLAACGLILATMGRPIFFVQMRVGRGGQMFPMVKLRTMAESEPSQSQTTVKADPRITRAGWFLRRFRIDELPQLWNVLCGHMSLVGPRPEQPELARTYAREMPAFNFRHLVRPGLTGWAQVRFGYAGNLAETREKLSYDLYYLKYLSLGLELKIVIATLLTLLRGNSVR